MIAEKNKVGKKNHARHETVAASKRIQNLQWNSVFL